MADKSLKEIKDRLAAKKGRKITPKSGSLNDLEDLVNDMLKYRGKHALPAGNKCLNKYAIAESKMTTCTCNNRTKAGALCHSRAVCSCKNRTTVGASCPSRTACSCNLRTNHCTCNTRTGQCYCQTRTRGGHSYGGSTAACPCNSRGFGLFTGPLCKSRTACNCRNRTTVGASCPSRTACSCNTRTTAPLDVFA